MPYEPLPDLATLSLAEIATLNAERKLPPVTQWNPQASSDSLMTISRTRQELWLADRVRRRSL